MPVLKWNERDPALEPAGIVAMGAVAKRLLNLLTNRGEETWNALSVVAARGTLLLMGKDADLPWIDGARYCAPDPVAPHLWLPTNLVLQLPSDLIQTQISNRLARFPVLLWDEPEFMLPIDQAASLSVTTIHWMLKEID